MRILTGKVVSKKMDKTATVEVTRVIAHRIYKKRLKRVKKYHVHDMVGVSVGDRVNFTDSQPFSKTKRWKILGVVAKKGK